MKRLIFSALLAMPLAAAAQVSYTGGVYLQDFNTLQGTTNNTTGVTWTNNSTLPGWYSSKSGYHVTNGTMGGTAGTFDATNSANNIGLISFGSAGSTIERWDREPPARNLSVTQTRRCNMACGW